MYVTFGQLGEGLGKKMHLFWFTLVMEDERYLEMLCTFCTSSFETFHHDLNLKFDWESVIKKYHLY